MAKQSAGKIVQVANQLGRTAHELLKTKKGLGSLQVMTQPLNDSGGTIELIVHGNMTESWKEIVKDILQRDLKEKVGPVLKRELGWDTFRIRRCPRNRSMTEYCWLIEKR